MTFQMTKFRIMKDILSYSTQQQKIYKNIEMKEIIEKIYSKVGIKESKLKIEIVQIVITSIFSNIEVISKIIQKGEYGKRPYKNKNGEYS